MSSKTSIFFVMIVCALAMAALFFLPVADTAASAEEVLERCAGEDDRALCYEREVPQLLPTHALEDVFDVIRAIRERDNSYQFCHVLAHKLGEQIVAEDPDAWIDAIALNPPDGLCSNGFIHGVVGGRFRAEVLDDATLERLIPDFSRACEPREGWTPASLDQAICYHGMGHLYMFITDADIPQALSLCNRTAGEEYQRVCIEGVFMQIYQPLEPDDFLLIERMPEKPSTTTVRQFCARYEKDEYEGACLRESWPYFRDGIMDGSGIEMFCSGQPNPREEAACYESAFTILGRQSLGDLANARSTCSAAPAEYAGVCYSRIALSALEEDRSEPRRAIAFCENAGEPRRSECLNFIVGITRFNFVSGSPQHISFCEALPVEWRMQCMR